MISLAATVGSSIVAAVALIATTIGIRTQIEANNLVQMQFKAQQRENSEQHGQFRSERETELAKLIFDKDTKAALKSYAIKELLYLDNTLYGQTGLEEQAKKKEWQALEASPVSLDRSNKLARLARQGCETYQDEGGGSGTTTVHMLDLRGADLTDVDLSHLSLTCVNLTGAKLVRTNMYDTSFVYTILDDVDMAGANVELMAAYWTLINPTNPDNETIKNINHIFGEEIILPCLMEASSELNLKAGLKGSCADKGERR